jgi:hypothetical protein
MNNTHIKTYQLASETNTHHDNDPEPDIISSIAAQIADFLRQKFPDTGKIYTDKSPNWFVLFVGDTKNEITVGSSGIDAENIPDMITGLMVREKRALINRQLYADEKAAQEAREIKSKKYFPFTAMVPDDCISVNCKYYMSKSPYCSLEWAENPEVCPLMVEIGSEPEIIVKYTESEAE